MSSDGKLINGTREMKSYLLIRLEENFEKITFWHQKDADYEKEKACIESILKNRLKGLLLKQRFK